MTEAVTADPDDAFADQAMREVQFRRRARRSGEHVCNWAHGMAFIAAGNPCPTCKARL